MAKKPTAKKTFKSLFSKNEANLNDTVAESVSADKKSTNADKKKFKFSGLKIKANSSGAPEKADPESEHVYSVEKSGLNGQSSADNVSREMDRSLLYATAPRSKGKEQSESEMDLSSKTKRFATINLGLRKKKKKEESTLSTSTTGIDSTGIEVQPQNPLDLSQTLAQNNTKTMSLSQPELDSSEKFDIPSPPPIAINKPEFVLQRQSETATVDTEPIKSQLIQNITNETPKAPIATIPELKLDDTLKKGPNETIQIVSTCKEATVASSKVEKMIMNITRPMSDTRNSTLVDNGNIQGSNTKPEIPKSQPAQPEKQLESKATSSVLKTSTTLEDKPEIVTATAINPKICITMEDKRPATDSSLGVASKMVAETPAIYSNAKSAVDISPNLQISQNNDNIPKSTSLGQSKMADQDYLKMVENTIEDKQPTINSTLVLDPKMAATNLDKQVQSSSNANKPANLDATLTETIYSNTKSTINLQNYVNRPENTFFSQSKVADQNDQILGITIEDKQPMINTAFNADSKMAATHLDKQVESSAAISNGASVSIPAKSDTTITETSTISSSEKFTIDPIVPSVKVSQNNSNISKTTPFSSQPKKDDQDKLYGELYDSLFPENFTQEVISSLLNTPSKLASEYKSLETLTETVTIKRFDNERSSMPLSTSSPQKTEENVGTCTLSSASANISTSVDEKSNKDAPKTVYIRKVTTYDVTSSTDAKPVIGDNKLAYSEFSAESTKYDTGHVQDTMKPSSYVDKSPPPFNYAPSQKTNAQVSADSKRKVVLVKGLVSDEATSTSSSCRDSGCPTPVMEKISIPSSEAKTDEFEILSITSGQTELRDGICSPAYLSVGSDDGSAMEIFFSAEEDNSDDLFTADATVIDSVLEDKLANRTIVLREDANVSVSSGEKTFELDLQRPAQVETGNGMFREREVMKAKNESKVELLTTPVEQVKEFEVVPPFTEEMGRKEGQGVSQTGLNDALQVQVDKNTENELTKNVNISKLVLESSSGGNKWQITPKFAEEAERVLSIENAKRSMLADSAREISDAGANNRATVSVQEADTVTERPGQSRAEQVADATQGQRSSSTILQIREETITEGELGLKQGLNQDQNQNEQDLRQRSLPPSQAPVIEQKLSDTAADPDAESMSSGYSSLSTTLSLKTSGPSQSEDSKYRFRKVSLVSESDPGQDVVDSSSVSANGTDPNTDYKWRNRFEGVHQFRPHSDTCKTSEYSHRSITSYTTDTITTATATALPEAIDYKSISSKAENPSSLSPGVSDRPDDTVGAGGCGSGDSREGLSAAPAPDWSKGEADGVGSLHSTTQREEDAFCGVFQATLVDLVPESPAARPAGETDEADDSPSQFDMDNLVDTLKNMGPSMRMRSLSARGAQSSLLSSQSLPPIVEDAPNPMLLNNNKTEEDGLNGNNYVLPPDIGLKKSSFRDMRSPLELLKLSQKDQQMGSKTLPMPLRASATNSIVVRSSADSSSPDDLPPPVLLNGSSGSRLDNSLIFSSMRTSENGLKTHRSLFRASSLPDIGHSNERMSLPPKEHSEVDPMASRIERFSFLMNSTSSQSGGSLTGVEDYASRISRPPPLSIGSPPSSNSPTLLLSPTGSVELNRTFTSTMADSSPIRMGPPLLHRSFSGDSGVSLLQGAPMFHTLQNFNNHFQSQEPEPERNLLSKYRAFPDAYLTKEKEHGKINPRPGKIYIFDRPGMCGQRTEIHSDFVDATSLDLQETISIRVVRGGWVLYEKPNYKGEKIALDEGEIELTYPFGPVEEEMQNGQTKGAPTREAPKDGQQNGEASESPTVEKPVRKFIIGSIRRAVRDYSVPEISLFPEQNAEGKKVVFRDSSDDARIFGFPIKANSIVINAGLWLVYAEPFFQGIPKVLEVGGYTNPEAWGVTQPYVASLHPLKIGEPRVENVNEPKMVVYEKPYYCGKHRTITQTTRDFMTRIDRQQQAFMHNVGSLKVMGGIWVGYEKEGFRGHQYLLEEGDYQDWRVWGGVDAELRSVRIIRADLLDPLMVMFEQPEEEQEGQEENTFEVTEAIADVELFGFKTSTRSIQVFSGAWVAYSHVDFSGSQYILEKGFYNNYADWGSLDNRICSLQPILTVPRDTNTTSRSYIKLYTDPDFQGQCCIVERNQELLSDKLLPKSCKVVGGSWVLYEKKQFQGNQHVLSEGDYPNPSSMGCSSTCYLRSAKAVPMKLSVPSISLFGLECLEGREITTETEIISLVDEGYNDHILSVRINSGCWVVCEYSDYRGRQFLLEPIEITNWPKFSSMETIGSIYPVRQRRTLFRVKNTELGHYLSVQGGVAELKSGRVVVAPEAEPMSDMWYYQDGLIKNKLSSSMCLQVMGNVEPAAKVILWTETRQPMQSWTAQTKGLISSLTFPGMVLDVKGGTTYDKDHVVIMPEDEDQPTQKWEIEFL